MPADASLERAIRWFQSQPRLSERFSAAIRQSFDEVFNGQHTGRYSLGQLSKVQKTHIGTNVELAIQAEFGLHRGHQMDYLVDGEEVDAKWSLRSGGWMIPTEAVGELCLCMTANDARSTFSVGIVRAAEVNLRPGANKDKKRGLNAAGMGAMSWLVDAGELDENLLLHLDDETRAEIIDYELSGQQRINQLFRRVHGKIVRREVVLTVAQQDDGPKRVRDARKLLQPEGIIILGPQGDHPRIVEALGLQIPPKGSWIAARVVSTKRLGRGSVKIDDAHWRLATPDDPLTAGPLNYQ